MLNNWHKKEKPFAGFAGFGGGATGLGFAGGSPTVTVTSNVGGTPFTPGDGYEYLIFPAPGSFTISGEGDIEYFVLAGGGGGGNTTYSGGGGAGGFRVGTIPVTPGLHPLTVGNGGPLGTNGQPSYIGPSGAKIIESSGGGGASNPGGSGGGHDYTTPTATPRASGNSGGYTPVEGYPGGLGYTGSCMGGGGGAGGAGADATPNPPYGNGGPGGIGRAVPGWNIPLSYGTSGPTPGRWFGGGGGAGNINVSTSVAGNGGIGGGGNGGGGASSATPRASVAGQANTGGGGGGGSNGVAAKPGGSGIIMIRYQV